MTITQQRKHVVSRPSLVERDLGISNFSIFPASQVLSGPSALINGNWNRTLSMNMKSTWQGLKGQKKNGYIENKIKRQSPEKSVYIKINPNDLNS